MTAPFDEVIKPKGETEFVDYVDAEESGDEAKHNESQGMASDFYKEAMEKYGAEGAIDSATEKKLVRKIDRLIIPILGICYFFYVSEVSIGLIAGLS